MAKQNLTPEEAEKLKVEKRRRAAKNRKAKDDLMRSLGLTKVRGAVTGKTYWE